MSGLTEASVDARVGARLREARKAAGLTLREAAARAGLHHSHLSKVENARDHATDRTVRLLCAVYDEEADVLLLERDIGRVPLVVRDAIEREARAPLEARVAALAGLLREWAGYRSYHDPLCGQCLGCRSRAALADAGTDCRTPGCGHPATAHDEGDWTCQRDDCECEEYTPRPDALTEHTHPESIPPCPACERAARADAERELPVLRELLRQAPAPGYPCRRCGRRDRGHEPDCWYARVDAALAASTEKATL